VSATLIEQHLIVCGETVTPNFSRSSAAMRWLSLLKIPNLL
jgi:hypothetical protein